MMNDKTEDLTPPKTIVMNIVLGEHFSNIEIDADVLSKIQDEWGIAAAAEYLSEESTAYFESMLKNKAELEKAVNTTRTGLSPKAIEHLSEITGGRNLILDDLIYKEGEAPERTRTKMPPIKWREPTEEERRVCQAVEGAPSRVSVKEYKQASTFLAVRELLLCMESSEDRKNFIDSIQAGYCDSCGAELAGKRGVCHCENDD